MTETTKRILRASCGWLLAAALLWPRPGYAHCDGLDGPVIATARKALATGKIESVIIWVQPKDDAEIRRVFQHTLAVRRLSKDARELADRFFFETLVRVHRAGEGAPYTGLKPAGRDLGPALPAADRALESGSPAQVLKLLTAAVHDGLHGRYVGTLKAKKAAKPGDVRGGREYVKAYVDYVHFVERLYRAAKGPAPGPGAERGGAAAHHED